MNLFILNIASLKFTKAEEEEEEDELEWEFRASEES